MWGGPGLDGFESRWPTWAISTPSVLTYVGAGAQIGAGVLLVLGLFTPLAAAAALAYLINGLLAAVAAQDQTRATSRSSCPTGTNTSSR